MKGFTAEDINAYIKELNQDGWWFIGQRKWTNSLANKVLAIETQLRKEEITQAQPEELGLVFLKALPEITKDYLKGFNRVYIFNETIQIHILACEDTEDMYLMAETGYCCDKMIDMPVIGIRPATSQSDPHPYLFASLLGSIPDSKISIKSCEKHGTWRLYHE
jgi:hypothetical protein